MSNPPPPGWWQASDGNWYPPTATDGTPLDRLPPPPIAAAQPKKSSGCAAVVVVVVLIFIAAAIIGAIVGSDDNDRGGEPDASAQLACRHFRNVAHDYSDGILTLGELRDKLKEVDDDAQSSREAGVASSARRLLAAATALDVDAMLPAIESLDRACTTAGA